MADEDLLAVRDWPSHSRFEPVEQAVLAAVDETMQTGRISPATWEECERHPGGDHQVLLELVVAIGTWSMDRLDAVEPRGATRRRCRQLAASCATTRPIPFTDPRSDL